MAKPKEDFSLKETRPNISGNKISTGPATAFDLVEQMNFLFVRVLKAKGLMGTDGPDSCHSYVEVKHGNYKGTTQFFEKNSSPEWHKVFAFSKEKIQSTELEIVVKDKANNGGEVIGKVKFVMSGIPTRVPPDSPLAPQWYRLEDKNGVKDGKVGELMLSVWMGTQADEAYSEAWHADAATASGDGIAYTQAKVYISPVLWYLRVNVIQAQDLVLRDKNRKDPEVFVKATLGDKALRTTISPNKNVNPKWNEDMMFAAAEPFEDPLVLSVEDMLEPNKEESVSLGQIVIPLQNVGKRDTNAAVANKWYNLERPKIIGKSEVKEVVKFASKLNMRVSLDGGYHVLDESTHYSSDLRPTSKPLWDPVIGTLRLGILNATGLSIMKPKEKRTDAYCVAKYGKKWLRTKTIFDSFAPQWNEQCIWEVYDLCTVITVGVFDNTNVLGGDVVGGGLHQRIGKVRIRLSTLESNRKYTHSHPLLVLQPSGVKKMGEIQLALMFSSFSTTNTLLRYMQHPLPKMHYVNPLSMFQIDSLRHQVGSILSSRLSRAVPPLRKEVVEYMLDTGSNMFSMRRSQANLGRFTELLKGFVDVIKWFEKICNWTNPIETVVIHVVFVFLVFFPQLVLPAVFFYLAFAGIIRFMKRPRHPAHMDAKLSRADTASGEELDEEFDSFPSKKTGEVLRRRYDRLRSSAGRMQVVLGDLVTQGERLQSLVGWRDPRATAILVCFCLIAGFVTLFIPLKFIVLLSGFYVLRHPRFRSDLPSIPLNFLRRMPAKTDSMF